MTTTDENTTETPKRKRSPNKPKTDFKLAEIATKKINKILARENAARDKAYGKIRERFQVKKDALLNDLNDTVKALVLAACDVQAPVENPDVSDSETEEDAVTAVAV